MKQKAQEIVKMLKEKGASYADIRIHYLDNSESISTLNGDIDTCHQGNKSGYGIRVLYNGAFGFASSEDFEEIFYVAEEALSKAKSASTFIQDKIELFPKTVFTGHYKSPCEVDPFTVPIKDKVEKLLTLDKKLGDSKFEHWGVSAYFNKRHILYVDSEGAVIEKELNDVEAGLYASAKDKDGFQQRRTYQLFQYADKTAGFENLLSKHQFDHTERIKQELLSVLEAPICEHHVTDVILLPEMMALQTHETIGHALELDRILGYELSYAGGSHISLEHFGNLQFGSEKLTARADGTVLNSPGSTGYDDDGVEGKNMILIEKGILKGAITSRQMIVEANKKAGRNIFETSGGACRAQSYNRPPIERMNNINVDFGNDGTLEDIIKDTRDGLILETPRSWSIGSNRENFHFATEIGWKVKDGEITHVVRNPSYRGDSLTFWKSLDKVGSQDTWQLQQTFYCGKGQPNQAMRLGHGVPICRFNNVEVGN